MRPTDPSDADVAVRATPADPTAFAQLAHFLDRFVGDRDLAEALARRAVDGALSRRPRRTRAWLYRTAYRGALNHIRPDVPMVELPDLFADDHRADHSSAVEATQLVWDAAATLDPRTLAILELTLRDGLTTRDLSHALAVSPLQAARLARRAREALISAVRTQLIARASCPRLAATSPAAVDRHLHRCPDCRELTSRLTAPLAVFAVLLTDPQPPVDDPAWAPVDPRRHLLLKTALTMALTLGLTAVLSLVPHDAIPPESAVPATTTELPAITTSAPTTPTKPPPPSIATDPLVGGPETHPISIDR
ncbi:sigma-70 family RNA polymerase sigma factor [Actinokineospora diospyrosa]|uniref:DNA-directed RNA polymerase specialized sigma subunit, sigma24 family n=1 Tax=Actinokineospora diospyrosa TaxID=103728 RepID=A0ABT1IAB2_9PSEU|nr:sigma-70 family RNA polymerase sigma factor [Actinokineospora diospyrosa]MCP2269567.1 DNA-directed RNA polymerase specialized sigma subunit, sigma24 family [Actinokineospora diospyrosa]